MKAILNTTVIGIVFIAGELGNPALAGVLYPGGAGSSVGPGTVNFTTNQGVPGCPPGLGGFTVVSTPNNNDYKPGDGGHPENCNQVGLTATFTGVGSVDIPLNVLYYTDAQGTVQPGTTEYLFKQKTLNNTGLAFNGFNFQLGFGTGNSFIASNTLDGLDFDVINANQIPVPAWGALEISADTFPNQEKTPTPISVINASPTGTDLTPVFNNLDHQGNAENWTNGTVPMGNRFDFNYSIDIPDLGPLNLNQIPVAFQTIDPRTGARTGYTFTLRMTATVPAPIPEFSSNLGILGFGAIMLGVGWQQRRLKKDKKSSGEGL